ncbi:thioredoxin-related transmembrane protein 3 isoform X2 [Arctopsyche grandis]|uniref:thioredoxin-related transmembrane protein 3 isoform X2 n=1 Tax=Arctopsyche grandis TaxID=121162 RepID=UPI00406D9BA4
MNLYYWIQIITLVSVSSNDASRVLELSDRFLEIHHEGHWLVMFYAPWCAYCHRLVPIWAHVAQALHTSSVKVARLDCTRFTAVANHYKVRAFPTIMFMKGSLKHEYIGEQSKDDLVNYALRMSGPSVLLVTKQHTVNEIKENNPIFFGYVGQQTGPLWEMFFYHAEKYQPLASFFVMSPEVANKHMTLEKTPVAFVYKESMAYFYSDDGIGEKQKLNTSLHKWIDAERFGTFPKVSRANINELLSLDKFLVLAVVEENKLNEITPEEIEFRDMIESVIRQKRDTLHNNFQFGWVGSPELTNSIVMSILPVPHLLVINSTTKHHHIPEDDPNKLTPEAVAIFLEQIYNQSAPIYGGDSFAVRLYRMYFQARTSLDYMWTGNPVLTTLIFGLPLGFLSLIFYSVCCTDILDAEEEDSSEEPGHEKKE